MRWRDEYRWDLWYNSQEGQMERVQRHLSRNVCKGASASGLLLQRVSRVLHGTGGHALLTEPHTSAHQNRLELTLSPSGMVQGASAPPFCLRIPSPLLCSNCDRFQKGVHRIRSLVKLARP